MNPIFQQIIVRTFYSKDKNRSEAEKEKYTRDISINAIRIIKDVFLITLGIFSAAFGLKGLILPNSFIDGGVTGISLLLTATTGFPLSLAIIVINIPFILLGIKAINKVFAFKTLLAIIGLAIVLSLVEFPIITNDKFLIALFGGLFLGVGIGLSIRGGAVIDGTEILAVYFSRLFNLSIGDFIFIFNVVIFSFAAYILSIEIAMYSIVIYMTASKTVDFIIEGIEEYTEVTIISDFSSEIKNMIIEKLNWGVTVYKGKGGYGKEGIIKSEIDILMTVITRLEVSRLNTEIMKIDKDAFIIMNSIKDTKGGIIKKRPLKSE